MKKVITIIMAILLIMAVCMTCTGCTANAGDAATDAIFTQGVEMLLEIAATAVITALGIGGAWLQKKIGTKTEMQNINAALLTVQDAAQQTVLELKQTTVDELKAAAEDGKLTQDEIKMLRDRLVNVTQSKMSKSAYDLLKAAGVDLEAYILGQGEALLCRIKNG